MPIGKAIVIHFICLISNAPKTVLMFSTKKLAYLKNNNSPKFVEIDNARKTFFELYYRYYIVPLQYNNLRMLK